MNSKTVALILLSLFVILGWNAFLIKRDSELFESYNQPSPKERYCKQQSGWHPDCDVE